MQEPTHRTRRRRGLHLEVSTGPETTILASTTCPFAQHLAGRVLLAGDAAHLTSPGGDMGMNGGPVRSRECLLRTSMIAGMRQAAEVA